MISCDFMCTVNLVVGWRPQLGGGGSVMKARLSAKPVLCNTLQLGQARTGPGCGTRLLQLPLSPHPALRSVHSQACVLVALGGMLPACLAEVAKVLKAPCLCRQCKRTAGCKSRCAHQGVGHVAGRSPGRARPGATPACSRSRCRAASVYSWSGGSCPLDACPLMICGNKEREAVEVGGEA